MELNPRGKAPAFSIMKQIKRKVLEVRIFILTGGVVMKPFHCSVQGEWKPFRLSLPVASLEKADLRYTRHICAISPFAEPRSRANVATSCLRISSDSRYCRTKEWATLTTGALRTGRSLSFLSQSNYTDLSKLMFGEKLTFKVETRRLLKINRTCMADFFHSQGAV
jgi:hypothetical protein